jgi:hypothetical protein
VDALGAASARADRQDEARRRHEAGELPASTRRCSTLPCWSSPTPVAQKARFHGELSPAEGIAHPDGTRFLDYFQQDVLTGEPKGIVALDLESCRDHQ